MSYASHSIDMPEATCVGPPPGPPEELNTLVEVARWRARLQPKDIAFTFLVDGEREGGHLTYAELDRRARELASALQARGVVGERVILLFAPGLDFHLALFACLYAGAIAVPAYPPDPFRLQRTLPRLEAIVRDAKARFVFGSEEILRAVRGPLSESLDAEIIALEGMLAGRAAGWTPIENHAEQPCILQYTSGSTGSPRGVVLTHGNLLHNMATMHLQDSEDVVGVTWIPPYHDMGLIGATLLPLYSGRRSVFMSPLAFLEQPVRWLRAISDYRGKTSGAPNFGYELCVRKIRPADCLGLDLSSWSIAVVGAEPVRPETIERFCEKFEPYGFRPQTFMPAYGLAESVLHVTGGQRGEMFDIRTFSGEALTENRVEEVLPSVADARRLVACGRPIPEERIAIVDPKSGLELKSQRVGEIWVHSPSVARGYWNRPKETERVFRARLNGENNGFFLRTGDLGFFHEGRLYVTGRLKELIILGGRNYYPQDIEATVRGCHPALAGGNGAAVSCEVDGREQLVIVHEARRSKRFDLDDVLAAVRREVTEEYLVSPYAVTLVAGGTMPKTSSGKIQRKACREMFERGELKVLAEWRAPSGDPDEAPAAEYVAPRTPLEAELAAVWAEVLRVERVGVHDNFFDLGGHSLLATQLYFRLRDMLPVELELEKLFERPTVAGLAELILAAGTEQADAGEMDILLEQLENMSEDEAERLLEQPEEST